MPAPLKIKVRFVELEAEWLDEEDTQVRRRAEGFEAALSDPGSKLRRAMASVLPRPSLVRGGGR